MNKKGFWKVLMVSLVMASAIGLLASWAMAQSVPTQQLLSDELGLQVAPNGVTVLLDNFQYWNSPRDMGWVPVEPAYPIYGAGIGYGAMETVVDFQEGSRVLDVYSNPSVFMPMNTGQFNPYTATKKADYRDMAGTEWKGIPGAFASMSYKVRAPLAIELFDTFSVTVRVRTMSAATAGTNGGVDNSGTIEIDDANPATTNVRLDVPMGSGDGVSQIGCPDCTTVGPFGIVDIKFVPRDIPQVGCLNACVDAARITSVQPAVGSFVTNTPEGAVYNANGQQVAAAGLITVAMGREFQDGSWHFETENLQQLVNAASGATDNLFEIISVEVRGNQYRLDDLMFTVPGADIANNNAPYLYRIGPVYGQLFSTNESRFVYASDDGLMVMARARNANGDLVYPFIQDAITAGFPRDGQTGFVPTNAVFAVPSAAGVLGGATRPANLNFMWTIGDSLGSVSVNSLASALPLPTAAQLADAGYMASYMRNMPYQVPVMVPTAALGNAANCQTQMTYLSGDNCTALASSPINTAYSNPQWTPANASLGADNPMYVVVCALVNSGLQVWPNVQVLRPSQGQVLEDLIVTCRVTDGLATDTETFPISIVNYPVTNLPPLIEQLEDQFFQVGQVGTYQLAASDPDASRLPNLITLNSWQDQAGLTFKASLNGLPNYQYGPWMEQIINPITGLIQFTPQFEGTLTCIVTVTDARGAQAVGQFNIFSVNPGTWLNHPPTVLEIIESPQMVRAGNLFTISDLNIADPDGQQLYYSCNIGSVGRNGIYTFQSEFPGEYLVQVTAYDILGGAVTQQFVLQVLPWWSF